MKKIVFVLSLLIFLGIVVLLITPSFIKPVSRVEVSYEFNIGKRELFSYFNDIKKFNSWNYWAVQDSSAIITYFYPYSGEKSSFYWKSEESTIGIGSYKIKKIELFKSINSEFTFNETEKIVNSKIVFTKISDEKTKIDWIIFPPKTTYFGRIYNLYVENFIHNKLEISLETLHKLIENSIVNNQELLKNKGKILEQTTDDFYIIGLPSLLKDDQKEIFNKILEDKINVRNYIKDSLLRKNREISNLYVYYEPINNEIITKKRKKIPNNKINLFVGYKVFDTIKLKSNLIKYKKISTQLNLVQFYEGNSYNKIKYRENFESYSLNKAKNIKKYYLEEYFKFSANDSTNSTIKIYQPIQP